MIAESALALAAASDVGGAGAAFLSFLPSGGYTQKPSQYDSSQVFSVLNTYRRGCSCSVWIFGISSIDLCSSGSRRWWTACWAYRASTIECAWRLSKTISDRSRMKRFTEKIKNLLGAALLGLYHSLHQEAVRASVSQKLHKVTGLWQD